MAGLEMDTITMKMIPPIISWKESGRNRWDATIKDVDTMGGFIYREANGSYSGYLTLINPFDLSMEIISYNEFKDFVSASTFIENLITKKLRKERKE